MKNQHQQGDVLMLRIDALPKNVKKVKPKNGRHILAEGEATGHAHAISDIKNCDFFQEEDGTLYMKCITPVDVNHEEHGSHLVEGIYEIGQVIEIDPFENEIREVKD